MKHMAMSEERKLKIALFIFYIVLIAMLVIRIMQIKTTRLRIPSSDEIIEHNCDEPKDFAKEKWMSEKQRAYYDHLYNQK